jgi:hypothetical protein
MTDHIQGNVELWREKGQWRMLLHAPSWVLNDLVDTMRAQGHPQVLVLANYGGSMLTGMSALFVTYGGGPIGSEPPTDGTRLTLAPMPPQAAQEDIESDSEAE